MEQENLHDKEYLKSKYRCPICGTLVGCNEDGKLGMFSAKAFSRHIANCRRHNQGKTGRVRYDSENE
jgi:hypothetical protein